MTTRAGFTLELRDTGDAIPVEVRLRHVLKALLRQYGFRCERIAMATAGRQSHVATPAPEQIPSQSAERASVADNEPCSGVPTGAFPSRRGQATRRALSGLAGPACSANGSTDRAPQSEQPNIHRIGSEQAVSACHSRCQF